MQRYDCAFAIVGVAPVPQDRRSQSAATTAEAARAPRDSSSTEADWRSPSGPGAGGAGQPPALLLATPAHKRPLDGPSDATDPTRRVAVSVTSDMSPMAPMAPMAPMMLMPIAKLYKQLDIEQSQCDDWLCNLPPVAAANASPFAVQTQPPPPGQWPGALPRPLPWQRPTPGTPPGTPPADSPSPQRPGQRLGQRPGQEPPLEPQPVESPIVDVYVEVGRILGVDGPLPWELNLQSCPRESGMLQCAIAVDLGVFTTEVQATTFAQLARAIYKTPHSGVTLKTLAEATCVFLCHGGLFLRNWVLEPFVLPTKDHHTGVRVRPTTDGRWSAVASIHRKWGRFATWQLKALGKHLLESGGVDEGDAFCALLNSAAEQAGVPGAGGGNVASPVIRRAQGANTAKAPPLLEALMAARRMERERLAPPAQAAQVTEAQAALEALALARVGAPVQPAAVYPKRARARNVAAPAPALAGAVTPSWVHPAEELSRQCAEDAMAQGGRALDDRVRLCQAEQRGYPSLVAMHIPLGFLRAICDCAAHESAAPASATPIKLGGLMAARQLCRFTV